MKFWKENKVNQEYELTIDEIKERYRKFLSTKEKSWVEYYGGQTVPFFVADREGLNSVAEDESYEVLQNELKEIRHEFYT